MSQFGLYTDQFFDKMCNINTLHDTIKKDINLLDSYLMTNKYFYININDDINTLLNSYKIPLPFFEKLLKSQNNNKIGFNQIKIYNKVLGNPNKLLEHIDTKVLEDDFFFRTFGSTLKIFNYFNKDFNLFNSLININLKDNVVLENRYLFDISSAIINQNYFLKMFELNYTYETADYNKSPILNTILYNTITKYQLKMNFLLPIYNNILINPFVTTQQLINGYQTYLTNNITNLIEKLYNYLYYNNFLLRNESALFNSDNSNQIADELLPELLEAFTNYISNHKINQYDLINKIHNRYCISNTHNITNDLLYINNTYNSNYLIIDLNDFLDLEEYIFSRYSIKFTNSFKQELEALQYFSLQYKLTPLYFINTQLFLHNYWINNQLFDKEYISLTELFDIFYNIPNLMNFIYGNIDFKTNVGLENIVFEKYKSLDNLDKSIKLSCSDFYSKLLFDFFESDDFKLFIANLVKHLIGKVNDYYLFEKNLYKYTDAVIMFFKYKSMKDYYDGILFNDVNSHIFTYFADIILNINNPPVYTIQDILINEKQFNHENLFTFLNNFTFSCKMNDYLLNIYKEFTV